ncbi:hypothetical protein ACJMK2_001116, partial [Sinanodonta woodiana]
VHCSDPTLLCQILQESHQAALSRPLALERNCKLLGLEFHSEIPADGNCFFEAVSSQLQRLNIAVQKSPQQLRKEVVAFMETNRVILASEGTIHLDSFIYNESFDDYCSRMAMDGEWADHVVVVAMARMLQIDIMIVTSSPLSSPEENIVWVIGKTSFQDDPILLGHIWESHYVSLQPIAQTSGDTPSLTYATYGFMQTTTYCIIRTHQMLSSSFVPCPAPTERIMQISASGAASSTVDGLIQAERSRDSSSLTSTADGVIHTATFSLTRTDLMLDPVLRCTTAVMQTPKLVRTTTNALLGRPVSYSPSTTAGYTPFLTSLSTTAVTQAPAIVHTAINAMLPTLTASTPSDTTGYIQCSANTSATPVVMLSPSLVSTTTDIVHATASVTKRSTTTCSTTCPTSTLTTALVMHAPSSGSNTIMQSSSSCSTHTVMQVQASRSTAANIMQTPTSGSAASYILQSTSSVSKASTTASLMPVQPSCCTSGGRLQPLASISMQSTPVHVTPSLDDTGRFVHIACLLVDVGSKVLRRLLFYHAVTPSCSLDQYLAQKRTVIDSLRKKKILNKSQMTILFPQSGSTNLGDYDITLLSALFTNIVNSISQQQLNMIQFLRDKRNEIFAHAKSVKVTSNDYHTFWNDICRTLEALSKQCNDPDFENEISRDIQAISVSSSTLSDSMQIQRRMDNLERLLHYCISRTAQDSHKTSDDSDS